MEPMETEGTPVISPESVPLKKRYRRFCNFTSVSPDAMAEDKKRAGNEEYKKKNYQAAIVLYTDAIALAPTTAAYYGNRSACYMMMGKFAEALEDARKALQIDFSFVKGYLREGKCLLSMGNAAAGVHSFQKALELEPGNAVAQKDLKNAQYIQQMEDSAQKAVAKGEYRKAVYNMDQCLQHVENCHKFLVQKAEYQVKLGRHAEAQRTVYNVLLSDSSNCDALYVRGLALYFDDHIDKALSHFQQVLKSAPDHKKAQEAYRKVRGIHQLRDKGKTAFQAQQWEEARSIYTQALQVDPTNKMTNSRLYYNRALATSRLQETSKALQDCDEAVKLDPTYIKAYHRRAKCYMELEQYEEAVKDYEQIAQLDPSRENKRLLKEAKLELKKSKRKDYYKILGVAKDANDDQIKKAYKKCAMVHHPDRHSHDTEEVQREEERKFKEVGEAYSVLSDAKKKARYDSGHDLEDLDGASGFGDDMDPNALFQMFFGGGGGFGGGHSHHHHGGAGFNRHQHF